MKTFIVVMYCQKIPIWRETIRSNGFDEKNPPPDLETWNLKLGMFGDELIVKEITDTKILAQLGRK